MPSRGNYQCDTKTRKPFDRSCLTRGPKNFESAEHLPISVKLPKIVNLQCRKTSKCRKMPTFKTAADAPQ